MKPPQYQHPLLVAVKEGNEGDVLTYLRKGVSPNHILETSRDSLLHIAVQNGHFRVLEQLLRHGAQTTVKNVFGDTPLHIAARKNAKECVASLLQFNVDNDLANALGNAQRVALHYAARYQDDEVAQLLIGKRAHLDVQDRDGRTPLHEAVLNNNMIVAKLLLANGAQPMVQDKQGASALHLGMEKRHLAMVSLLLAYDAHFEQKDLNGKTAFEAAEMSGSDLMKLAIEQHLYSESLFYYLFNSARLDLNCIFAGRMGLLHIAAMNRQVETAAWLLNHGIFVSQLNSSDYTTLHIAAKLGDLEMVKLLVEKGIKINHRDKLGENAIDKAIKQLSQVDEGEKDSIAAINDVIWYLRHQMSSGRLDVRLASARDAASAFRLESVVVTSRMQRRKLIGSKYYQMTRIHRKEAAEIAEKTGLEISFEPDEEEKRFILGRGNFGLIKVAFRREIGEYVASKKISGEANIAKSKAEAYIQQEAAGPNVLPIFNTVELSNVLYHFMPLAGLGNGRSIQVLIAHVEPNLRIKVLISIAQDILRGLMTCHRQGIYHLDIKPENLVFKKDGMCYITDFGCARKAEIQNPQISGDSIGDYRYFSPERSRASKNFGQFRADRADIWAAGLTLLELLTNQNITHEFEQLLPLQSLDRHLEVMTDFFREQFRKVLAFPSAEIEGVCRVIRGLLETDENRRMVVDVASKEPCFSQLDALAKEILFKQVFLQSGMQLANKKKGSSVGLETYQQTPASKEASSVYANDWVSNSNSSRPEAASAGGITSSPYGVWVRGICRDQSESESAAPSEHKFY